MLLLIWPPQEAALWLVKREAGWCWMLVEAQGLVTRSPLHCSHLLCRLSCALLPHLYFIFTFYEDDKRTQLSTTSAWMETDTTHTSFHYMHICFSSLVAECPVVRQADDTLPLCSSFLFFQPSSIGGYPHAHTVCTHICTTHIHTHTSETCKREPNRWISNRDKEILHINAKACEHHM